MANPECLSGSEFINTSFNSFEKIPRGDGHTIILIEGLYETPQHMNVLADRLNQIGYTAVPSGMDRNRGHESQQDEIIELVDKIVSEEGEVYLLGHSLGGRMAIKASENPGVKKVVTMGSPILDLCVPPETQVLCLVGTHDIIIPFPFSSNAARNVRTQAVFSLHLQLINSSSAFEKAGEFFAL